MHLPENTISVHVFQKNGFPIILYARDEWEQNQIEYLENNYQKGQFNTYIIGQWSKSHDIPFEIFYPSILTILTKPVVMRNFLYMKRRGF